MEVETLVESGVTFFRDYTFWAVLTAVVIGFVVYWKPKGTIRVVGAGLVVVAIVYVLAFLVDLTSEGIDEVEKFSATPKIDVE